MAWKSVTKKYGRREGEDKEIESIEERVEDLLDRSVGYYDGQVEAMEAKAEEASRILLKVVGALSKNKDVISEEDWMDIVGSDVIWEGDPDD